MLTLEVPRNRKIADAWELCVSKVIKKRVKKVISIVLTFVISTVLIFFNEGA